MSSKLAIITPHCTVSLGRFKGDRDKSETNYTYRPRQKNLASITEVQLESY